VTTIATSPGPSAGAAVLNDRLVRAMPRVVAAVHGLATELDVTNDELVAVLGFLGEVGRADEFILLSDVLGLSRLVDDATHRGIEGTSSNVLGPFYRPDAPHIGNPGSIASSRSVGEALVIGGRIADAVDGSLVADATVDVWQADGNGRYSDEADPVEPWDLRGRQTTTETGRFEIATVRPLHYTVKDDGPVGRLLAALGRHPWRPAHIHLLVSAAGHRSLVTQVYVAGGLYLDDDTITGVKQELVAPVVDGRITFDVALPRDASAGTVAGPAAGVAVPGEPAAP
jgi:protocatechuate 3,4-dioxygenase beta subunit